jgi:hypothetical protein
MSGLAAFFFSANIKCNQLPIDGTQFSRYIYSRQNGVHQMTFPVAETILAQLGGNKFRAMTGATLSGGPDQLTVCLGRSRAVVIKLAADDTYTVSLHKPGRFTAKGDWKQPEPVTRTGVYCDQLQSIFTELTGLYTSL